MYEIKTRNEKIKKKLEKYIFMREGISKKFKRLKENPRKGIGAPSSWKISRKMELLAWLKYQNDL